MEGPLITTLNFSGGGASTALLLMVLDGTIPRPDNFHVITADPGMEDPRTYKVIDDMEARCLGAGIPFHRAPGPNLAADLLNAASRQRIDLPPYWTVDENGKRGKLTQRCTQEYKIRPMDRVVRRILETDHGIPQTRKRIGTNIVERWVGFTADEAHRCSKSLKKYWYFRYPLIELGWTRENVIAFLGGSEKAPPRSVCAACFANGARYFMEMAANRPKNFELACQIDEAIRDMRHLGVRETVYVSRTCTPLRQLVDDDTDIDLGELCNSGVCMT